MKQINVILGTMTFAGQVDKTGAEKMIDSFQAEGGAELDTAFMYCDGKTEKLLGEILTAEKQKIFQVATKINPWNPGGLKPEEIIRQFNISLERMKCDSVDLLYLHSPDLETPIEQSLETIAQLFSAGKFKTLGLSNYAAWQVAEIMELTKKNGWPVPVVYQGMYNALTRDVERELFPCLRHYGLKFYAYNPLAGGLLTGKYSSYVTKPEEGRFNNNKMYQERFWKPEYFNAIQFFQEICKDYKISPANAALSWLANHSFLSSEKNDGIIIGASSQKHFEENLTACKTDPLPEKILSALEKAWEAVKPACPKYFRP
jgi:aflatoxin B1 aldehyde reductase